jgi:acetyl-CoA carboxylase biotin carboxyl carrier protein
MVFKDVDLKKLIQLMKENDLSEISLKDGKTAVELKRNKNEGSRFTSTHHQLSLGQVIQPNYGEIENQSVDTFQDKVQNPPPVGQESIQSKFHEVETPLVGTFYRSAAPGQEPFVEVGDQVKSGDVLCIVEAMKSMNEIQADVDGVVKEICVNNADLVEYEQVLFKIEPSK